ncbi:MAG: glycosyltransferase [Acidobacteriota bacterium]|nr:glycosyltransferase [Acidobacteriota bacterium]
MVAPGLVKPMRILQVCSATAIGGGELHVADLVVGLRERGHEVHVAVRPGSPLLERVSPHVVAAHVLPLRNSLDGLSAYRLSRVIRDYDIEIVHAHLGRDYLPAIAAALWSRRARVVLTRHHYLPLRRNFLSRAALRRAGRIIAVSEFVRRSLLTQFGLPETQVVTIPNWVRWEEVMPLPEREEARARFHLTRPWVITTVGQLAPAKGQEDFLRAAALLGRGDCEFLIVGAASAKHRGFEARLRRLARDLNLQVHFLGHVDDLRPIWAASDLFVLPSHGEGFSLVLIQAMVAGVPVIAFAAGGPTEIVAHGETGFLVPPRDVAMLVERMRELLDDSALRARLAHAARESVRQRFDRERILRQIESVYEAVRDRPVPSRSHAL